MKSSIIQNGIKLPSRVKPANTDAEHVQSIEKMNAALEYPSYISKVQPSLMKGASEAWAEALPGEIYPEDFNKMPYNYFYQNTKAMTIDLFDQVYGKK